MLPIFVGFLLSSAFFESSSGAILSRINKGNTIDIKEAPYMARVRIKINATVGGACGGTILTDKLILTAGHCVTEETNMNKPDPPLHGASNFSILVGTDDLNDEESGEVVSVSKVHFKEFSQQNDMAILELSERIMLDGLTKDITFLPLDQNYRPKNRTKCFVEGWGKNQQKSKKLLRATVYTISEEECNTGADAGRDRSHQICTLGKDGAGPCTGDSGGPLIRVSDGTQIGLVSFVPVNCASPGKTVSTFTAIAPNLEWIRGVMQMASGSDAAAAEGKGDTAGDAGVADACDADAGAAGADAGKGGAAGADAGKGGAADAGKGGAADAGKGSAADAGKGGAADAGKGGAADAGKGNAADAGKGGAPAAGKGGAAGADAGKGGADAGKGGADAGKGGAAATYGAAGRGDAAPV